MPDSSASRTVIDVQALEWHSRTAEGVPSGTKVLRMNNDYSYVGVTRAPGGIVAPGHVHVGPIELFFLEGEVETVAGIAGKGCWVLEPAGAMHRASRSFAGEKTLTDVVALTHTNGPMLLLDADGAAPPVMYGQSLKANVAGGTEAPRTAAELTALMFPEDYESGIVRVADLDWVASGYEGIRYRIVNVTDGGRFCLIIQAADGAEIPARRYTAPADFYVISGCIRFADQDAPEHHWVYEPAGATEGVMTHAGETTYLATFAGAFADLCADESVSRLIDASVIRRWSSASDSASHIVEEPVLSNLK